MVHRTLTHPVNVNTDTMAKAQNHTDFGATMQGSKQKLYLHWALQLGLVLC
jgi:hypothetical protein